MFSCISLLILSLKVADCSMKVATSVQDDSGAIHLEMSGATNMSKASLTCLFENGKVLFRMENGEKKEASIAAEYKGRVQYSYNTTEGLVYLKLPNFTKDDEGQYTCNYRSEGQSESDTFVLKVNHTEPDTTPTAGPGPTPTAGPGPTQRPTEPLSTQVPPKENSRWLWWLALVPVVPVVLGLLAICKVKCQKPQVRDEGQNPDALELQNLNGDNSARNKSEDNV